MVIHFTLTDVSWNQKELTDYYTMLIFPLYQHFSYLNPYLYHIYVKKYA